MMYTYYGIDLIKWVCKDVTFVVELYIGPVSPFFHDVNMFSQYDTVLTWGSCGYVCLFLKYKVY